MPYDEKLADRVREIISASQKHVEEKRMFGGLSFMVNDKMCVGVKTDRMMVRIDPEVFEEAQEKEGFKPMVHNGKTMTGFGFVDIDVLKTNKQLNYWVQLALDYNKAATQVKKKPKATKSASKSVKPKAKAVKSTSKAAKK